MTNPKRYDWHTDGMWCTDSPDSGKWVSWDDYERLDKKCAALAFLHYNPQVKTSIPVEPPAEPHVIKQIENALDDCRDQIAGGVASYIRGCISDYRHTLNRQDPWCDACMGAHEPGDKSYRCPVNRRGEHGKA